MAYLNRRGRISRRELLIGTAVSAPLLAQKKGTRPPNIVLLLADGLGAWTLGCYGNQEIRTPNIDLLARSGIRFANHYVATPASSASRATLLTGRTARQHGILDLLGPSGPPPTFKDEVMLSDILSGQGYNCGYVGNWGLGANEQPQHGYRLWYVVLGSATPFRDPKASRNGDVVQEKGYTPDLITGKALEFLDQQKPEKPFFLTISYPNPHPPYEGHPAKYYEMYAATKFETVGWDPPAANAARSKEFLADIVGNLRKAAAATTALDDQIPSVVNKLDERGFRDDTLIVFTATNGFLLGRHGLWSGGLASDPPNMFEEVLRTPMVWNWLGKTPPEAVRPELVSAFDVLPSLCEAAGAAAPNRNLCGRSYLPVAQGKRLPKDKPWQNVAFADLRSTQMVRDTRYKMVSRNEGQGPNELYDLRTDPREKQNLSADPQFVTVRDALTARLAEWWKKYS